MEKVKQKVAVKSSTGNSYIEPRNLLVDGLKLSTHFNKIKEFKASAMDNLGKIGKLLNEFTSITENQKQTVSSLKLEIKNFAIEMGKMGEAIKEAKYHEVSIKFMMFKVDLSMGLLPDVVKQEFLKNNTSGRRLRELQQWYNNLSPQSVIVLPPELKLYRGDLR